MEHNMTCYVYINRTILCYSYHFFRVCRSVLFTNAFKHIICILLNCTRLYKVINMQCVLSLIRCRPAVNGALLDDNMEDDYGMTQWRVSSIGQCQAANRSYT